MWNHSFPPARAASSRFSIWENQFGNLFATLPPSIYRFHALHRPGFLHVELYMPIAASHFSFTLQPFHPHQLRSARFLWAAFQDVGAFARRSFNLAKIVGFLCWAPAVHR